LNAAIPADTGQDEELVVVMEASPLPLAGEGLCEGGEGPGRMLEHVEAADRDA